MSDLAMNGVSKAFGEDVILQDVSLDVQPGQHVGVIGKNGGGKTSLFRILSGEWQADTGTVSVARGRRVGLLAQLPRFAPGATVEDVLRGAFAQHEALQEKLRELEAKMADGAADDADLARYGELADRFEASGGYDADVQLAKVAAGLSITELLPREFARISGGEQTRANLARLILADTDILLLDEPTNHLDIHSVEWLEGYIASCRNTVLVVSHDRWFLDKTVTRIIEVENHTTRTWEGNYSAYMVQKEQYLEDMERHWEKTQKEIDRLSYTSARMHGWGMGNEKMMHRAFALDKRIERLRAQQGEQVHRDTGTVRGGFREAADSGNEVLTVSELCKSFGERTLFSDVDLSLRKGESVAILGDNGAGKTTFLKILLGDEEADRGRVRWGANVRCAYLPQVVHFADESLSLVDTLCAELKLTPPSARNRLGAFRFSGEDVFKPVSALSGGEKSRLKLCILMFSEINVLILDEPTNHLDIRSREWLEGALEQFEGTLIFVSHDRYFISRFATRVWMLEQGGITDFEGTYTRFEEVRSRAVQPAPAAPREEKQEKPKGNHKQDSKRLAAVEREIAALEARQTQNRAEQEAAAFDAEALLAAMQEQSELEAALEPLYEEWAELSARLEE